jgi:hypothetical protein
LADEVEGLLRGVRSSLCGLGLDTPVATEEVTVPTEESLWLDDEKGLFPELATSGEEDEEESVGAGDLWTLAVAAEHNDLVAEECVFDQQVGSGACEVGE